MSDGTALVRVIKDPRIDAHYRIGEREAAIVTRLDGRTTLAELRADYEARFGRTLTDAALGQIFGLLAGRHLLDEPPAPGALEELRTQRANAEADRATWRFRKWPLGDPSPFLRRADRAVGWLFAPPVFWSLGAAVMAVAVSFAARSAALYAELGDLWQATPERGVFALLIVLASLLLHEVGHGLACTRLGGQSREIGLAWHAPMVTLYCRTDDVYLMPSRSSRVVVSLSGMYVGLLSLVPFYLLAVLAPAGPVTDIAVVVATTGSWAQLVNALPVPPLDGAKALSHAFGVWNLPAQARPYWLSVLTGRRRADLPASERWAYRVYGAAAATVVVLVGFFATRWWLAMLDGVVPPGVDAGLVAGGWLLAAAFMGRRLLAGSSAPQARKSSPRAQKAGAA